MGTYKATRQSPLSLAFIYLAWLHCYLWENPLATAVLATQGKLKQCSGCRKEWHDVPKAELKHTRRRRRRGCLYSHTKKRMGVQLRAGSLACVGNMSLPDSKDVENLGERILLEQINGAFGTSTIVSAQKIHNFLQIARLSQAGFQLVYFTSLTLTKLNNGHNCTGLGRNLARCRRFLVRSPQDGNEPLETGSGQGSEYQRLAWVQCLALPPSLS